MKKEKIIEILVEENEKLNKLGNEAEDYFCAGYKALAYAMFEGDDGLQVQILKGEECLWLQVLVDLGDFMGMTKSFKIKYEEESIRDRFSEIADYLLRIDSKTPLEIVEGFPDEIRRGASPYNA